MVESQFHYGSIKTIRPKKVFPKLAPSQFHYGSIKTRETIKPLKISNGISIPLWFD